MTPRILALLLALLVAGAVQARGNAEKGKALAEKKDATGQACATCHGVDGSKPDSAEKPILAGQYYDYLVKALSDYKSGKRVNALMNGVAKPLSKQEIEDLSAWFATQKSALHFQR
jgi:cytochrome c553